MSSHKDRSVLYKEVAVVNVCLAVQTYFMYAVFLGLHHFLYLSVYVEFAVSLIED